MRNIRAYRLMVVMAACLAAGSFVLNAKTSGGPEDLLRLEDVRGHYQSMGRVPDAIGKELSEDFDKAPDEVKRLTDAIGSGFDPQEGEAAMIDALASLDAPPHAEIYAEAATVAETRRQAWQAGDAAGTFVSQAESDFRARADRDQLQAVAASMASPEMAAELALAQTRLKVLVEQVLQDGTGEFDRLDTSQREAGLDVLFKATREKAATEMADARQMETGRQTILLLPLSPDAVTRLEGAYGSVEGRAQHAAIIAAFRARIEASTRAAMLAYMAAVSPAKS